MSRDETMQCSNCGAVICRIRVRRMSSWWPQILRGHSRDAPGRVREDRRGGANYWCFTQYAACLGICFWRFAAFCTVLGLFYVGHGLHQTPLVDSTRSSFPRLTSVAHAGGGANGATIGGKFNVLYTQSADGKTVYSWVLGAGRSEDLLKKPKFSAAYRADNTEPIM